MPDSAYVLAEAGLKLSVDLKNAQGEGYMLVQLGGIDRIQGRQVLAKVRMQNALDIYEKLGNKKAIATVTNELGVVEGSQGNYDTATRLFIKALRIFDELSDTTGKVQSYIKLGVINEFLDNLEKAKSYYTKALELSNLIHDTVDMVYIYNNMCIAEGKKGNYKRALEYCELALPYCTTDRYTDVKTNLLLNKGIVYREMGDEGMALKQFNEALKIVTDMKQEYPVPNLLLNISLLEHATPHERKIPLLQEALAIAKRTDQNKIVVDIYETMADVYVEENNYKAAYLYRDSAYAIKNRMFTLQKNSEIANLETLYELDKSHHKVAQLEQQSADKNFQRNVLIAVAALIAIALVVVINMYRKTRLLNAELKAGKEELNEANKIKDKIFSVIGHDLRTPTTSIIGMLYVLDADHNDMSREEEKEVYKMLKRQSEASLETLNKMLLWGSKQIKGISMQQEHFEVRESIESNVKLLQENATEKQITLYNKVQEGVAVFGDTSHFDFIIRNLLSNGIKFSKAGGTVEVGVSERDLSGYVCFYVKDDGIGIANDIQANIFGLNNKSRLGTGNEKGTGLGLVLCREFVEQAGGKIWVESTEGKGATFFFLVKCKKA